MTLFPTEHVEDCEFNPPLPHLVLDSLPPEFCLELLRLASRNVKVVPQSRLHELSRLPIAQRGFDVFLNVVVNLRSTKEGKINLDSLRT